jgi:hypothetical protein
LQFNRVLQDRAVEQAGQLVASDLADRFWGAKDQGKFQPSEGKEVPSPASTSIESPAISESQKDLLTPHPLIN